MLNKESDSQDQCDSHLNHLLKVFIAPHRLQKLLNSHAVLTVTLDKTLVILLRISIAQIKTVAYTSSWNKGVEFYQSESHYDNSQC